MPRRRVRIFAFAGLILVLLAMAAAFYHQDARPGIDLASHRGLYSLKTVAIHNSATIANVKGTMFYDWRKSCDSWITNQKFHLEFLYPEGVPSILNSSYSTVESRDGRHFHFTTQRERNFQQMEEIRGDAERSGFKKSTVRFTKPEEAVREINAKFPTMHTMALLDAAKRGKTFFNAPLFDGSEVAPPVDVYAYISKAQKAPDEIEVLKANPLLQSPLYKIRMAFFSNETDANKLPQKKAGANDRETGLPDYEMTLWIHENGVVSEYQIDYPDFSLNASLDALETLPDDCK